MSVVHCGSPRGTRGEPQVTLIVVSSPRATETCQQFVEWAKGEGFEVLQFGSNRRNASPWRGRYLHLALFLLTDLAQGDWASFRSLSASRRRVEGRFRKNTTARPANFLLNLQESADETGKRHLVVFLGSSESQVTGELARILPCLGLDFIGWHGDDRLIGRTQVLEGQPYVDFALWQRLPGEERAQVLLHAKYQTRRTVSESASVLRAKGLEHLKRAVDEFGVPVGPANSSESFAQPSVPPAPAAPTLATSLRWLLSGTARGLGLIKARLIPRQRHIWHVEVGEVAGDGSISNTVIVPNPDGGWLADPHLHTARGLNYLFVEEYRNNLGRARISVLDLSDLDALSPIPVLEESFHLSFPWVFKYDASFYMVVESSQADELRIYRALDFPFDWVHEASHFVGSKVVDAMIVEGNKQWFLLANIDETLDRERNSELHVFVADDPISGAWRPAKGNPQVVDCERARNGGLFAVSGTMYRVGQRQGYLRYGEGCSLFRVTRIDEGGYSEVVVPNPGISDLGRLIEPDPAKWGPHTLSISGGRIAYDLAVEPRRRFFGR